jgi:hypothetical protein
MALSTRYAMTTGRCCYCGKWFAANKMVHHKESCIERIKKAPIETLTRKQAQESGRYEEFKQALRS